MELNSTQLIDDYLDGELEEDGGERLCAWLDADPKHVQMFVSHVFLHRQLREAMLAQNVGKCLEASDGLRADTEVMSFLDGSDSPRLTFWSYIPMVLAVLLGVLSSSVVTWQIAARWFDGAGNTVATAPPSKADAPRHGAGPYVATLVNVTNCRWDQALSTADLKQGSVVHSGESLHLLEGVADINSTLKNGGLASLQLEGPLAMTLNSQGMPSLLYGHLTGKFACDYDQFALDTPLGRVNVSGDASIGVIAAANKVELHVFSGTATLDLWAMSFGGTSKQLTASAGTALSARVEADGKISVDHGESKESGFITPAALAASRLHITPEYAATIRAAKPVGYWRFEGDVDGVMRNEMGDKFHCRMVGDAVRWHTGEGNSTAEFGMTAGPGYLISDDILDGVIGDDYSLEAWVKPTYYHHGALISLIQWSPTESPLDRHRFALELCGPSPGVPSSILRSPEFHPGRIRFIHQTSACYSSSPYRVRTWQHIAAVREHSLMRLYADGKVVATAEDPAPLGSGLRVLMGQLFPRNPYMKDEVSARLFVGELDEVALYNRALSDEEIQKHVQLARPESDSAPTGSDQKLK
jgi:Concanavalin A-like lectin/glucanases superfamily